MSKPKIIISSVRMSGFRGFSDPQQIQFADSFNVLCGRNGVGKTTVFDAIEFALTGRISRLSEIKIHNGKWEDYVWNASAENDRQVEVAFVEGDEEFRVSRGENGEANVYKLESPGSERALGAEEASAFVSKCAEFLEFALVRDEYISSGSIDLDDGSRFSAVRAAIAKSSRINIEEKLKSVLATAKKESKDVGNALDEAQQSLEKKISDLKHLEQQVRSGPAFPDTISLIYK